VQALLDTPVEEFDVTYLTAQVAAHEQALAVFTAQAEEGDNWKVAKFARTLVPTLQHHFELAQETLDALAVPVG
jgi:putative membrane protein